eukprot:GFYU01007274.1.p1 GENE.GFYU01007274.1~~GFYU01007274.1.p1  ORF type:complete len:230 (+),score=12.53 GFYU01007274.1:29-718(+)
MDMHHNDARDPLTRDDEDFVELSPGLLARPVEPFRLWSATSWVVNATQSLTYRSQSKYWGPVKWFALFPTMVFQTLFLITPIPYVGTWRVLRTCGKGYFYCTGLLFLAFVFNLLMVIFIIPIGVGAGLLWSICEYSEYWIVVGMFDVGYKATFVPASLQLTRCRIELGLRPTPELLVGTITVGYAEVEVRTDREPAECCCSYYKAAIVEEHYVALLKHLKFPDEGAEMV